MTKRIRPAATAPTCAGAASKRLPVRGLVLPVGHDADLYMERNTVERLINKRKAWRGIATRYDKTPGSYPAGLHLRASMIWIKETSPGPAGDQDSIRALILQRCLC